MTSYQFTAMARFVNEKDPAMDIGIHYVAWWWIRSGSAGWYADRKVSMLSKNVLAMLKLTADLGDMFTGAIEV